MRSCFEEQSGKAPTNLRTHDYANELHERFSAEKMYKKFVDLFKIEEDKFDVQEWLNELEITETE
jgi:hypothetical protein